METLQNEVSNIRDSLLVQTRSADLQKITGREIARCFQLDFWELSPRELDHQMGMRLSILNDSIKCTPDGAISSHRRFFGPFIVFLKKIIRRFFWPDLEMLFARQNLFNERLVAFHLASFIRFHRDEEKLRRLSEELRSLTEQLAGHFPSPQDPKEE